MHRMQQKDVVVKNCSTLTVDNEITEEQAVDGDEEEPAQSPRKVLRFALDKNTGVEGETEEDGNDGTDGEREEERVEQQVESSSRQNVSKLSFLI